MPVIHLFVNLFGNREKTDVKYALKYVVPCLNPLNIGNKHKYKIAAAMKQTRNQSDSPEIKTEINNKARQLGLKWFEFS